MLTITIRHGTRYYRAQVSPRWAEEHDNGAIVSCGLTVGDTVTELSLQALIRKGRAIEITKEEYDHSSCQSECVRRGGRHCSW